MFSWFKPKTKTLEFNIKKASVEIHTQEDFWYTVSRKGHLEYFFDIIVYTGDDMLRSYLNNESHFVITDCGTVINKCNIKNDMKITVEDLIVNREVEV